MSAMEGSRKDKFKKLAVPLLGIVAVAFIAVAGGLCLSGTINLAGRTTSLHSFGERMEFTCKYLVLGVLWLVILIGMVIGQRFRTGAVNPLDGKELGLKKQANILQNSFEQYIISAFAQLTLVAFLDETYTLRTIPMVNFLFIIGRIAFLLGYPNYRTFGFMLCILPSFGMTGVAVYKFCEHLFA